MIETLKNIWNNRGLNGWLFVEIVLITVPLWLLAAITTQMADRWIDDLTDKTYDTSDLVLCGIYPIVYEDGSRGSEEDFKRETEILVDRIRNLDNVESASVHNKRDTHQLAGEDTTAICHTEITKLTSNCQYFRTMGINSLTNRIETLDSIAGNMKSDEIIISKALAKKLLGSEDVIGKTINEKTVDMEAIGEGQTKRNETWKRLTIVDVVENQHNGKNRIHFDSYTRSESPMYQIIVRAKEGVSAQELIESRTSRRNIEELTTEHMLATRFMAYDDFFESAEEQVIMKIVAVFAGLFVLNVFIGIAGTFWLQIRQRREDIGIRRSFGATQRGIIKSIMSEGMLMAVIATVVGLVAILQFSPAINGPLLYMNNEVEDFLMYRFWPHFIIVSAVELVVILCIVMVGVWIPAKLLSRKKPVEALREN